MKKALLIFLVIIASISFLAAQNETNNWFFGSNCGVTFSSGSAVSISTGSLNTYEGSTSASNAITGNLLFYSDGVSVFDSTNTEMPSGSGLLGSYSSTMAALAVPLPGSTSIYYLFTTDGQENIGANGFNYSIIDMDAHGGLGDVTSPNNLLFTPCGEVNHAVKHANCTDYWIVARGVLDNTFRTYLLSASGVSTAVVSSLGVTAMREAYGQGKFSPDGNKFAVADGVGGTIQLFDFNTSTGVFSNAYTLHHTSEETYGLSFSPDNTKLYAGAGVYADSVYQWDLTAGDSTAVRASRTFIGMGGMFDQFQLGKDYKLYLANFGSLSISVINNPNLAGIACDLVDDAVPVSGFTNHGLPAFPESYFNSTTPCLTPLINAQAKGLKCFNDSSGTAWLEFSNIKQPRTVNWSPGGMTADTITGLHAGTYYATVTDSAGIIYYDTVIINQPPLLTASIFTANDSVCTHTSDTLSAMGGGGTGSYSYLWNSSAGTGISATYSYTPAVSDSVTLTITDSNNCVAVSSVVVVVIASPEISFIADTTEGCEPTTITFTSVTDQPDGNSLWNFGDGNSSRDANPAHTYTSDNVFTVTYTYTNSMGCSTSVIQNNMITIHSQPEAIYTANPQPATIVNPNIHFTDHSTGVIDNWKWSFGTGDSSFLQNPTYTYIDSRSFPIQLIVTNNFGCSDTAAGSIVIEPVFTFYAPNAFTPDGNSVNDEFMIKGENINLTTFEMRIFDRWGELIYLTQDIKKGWNGTMNNSGEILKQDEYVWKVDFRDFSNTKHSYIGQVVLIR